MKKKLLKIFSIIFSIATLMPTITSVVWAVKTPQDAKSEEKEKTEEESDGGLSEPTGTLKITDTITPPFYGCKIELKKVPKKNRSQSARQRQEGRTKFRYLSQVYTNGKKYTPKEYEEIKNKETPTTGTAYYDGPTPLETPFENVQCQLTKYIPKWDEQKYAQNIEQEINQNEYDMIITKESLKTRYEEIIPIITKILNKEDQKNLAKEILKYLETPVNKKIEKSNFFESSEFLGSLKNEDLFYMISNYLKSSLNDLDKLKENIISAKKHTAILCGILFIAEPCLNRMGDGGKSARSVLRAIANGDKTFYQTFVDNGNGIPWYPIAMPGGAQIAKWRSMGRPFPNTEIKDHQKLSEQYFEEIEDLKYMSDSSDDESSKYIRGFDFFEIKKVKEKKTSTSTSSPQKPSKTKSKRLDNTKSSSNENETEEEQSEEDDAEKTDESSLNDNKKNQSKKTFNRSNTETINPKEKKTNKKINKSDLSNNSLRKK